jgi:thioredoxin-like negative regulator of GroEL
MAQSLFLFCLLFFVCWASEKEGPSGKIGNYEFDGGIMKLESSNIDSALETFPSIIIEFFNPLCSHCQKFKPVYEEIQKLFMEFDIQMVLARVNCLKNSELIDVFDVKYFPYITHFSEGQKTATYAGDRKMTSIIPWLLENSGIEMPKELENYLKNNANTLP